MLFINSGDCVYPSMLPAGKKVESRKFEPRICRPGAKSYRRQARLNLFLLTIIPAQPY